MNFSFPHLLFIYAGGWAGVSLSGNCSIFHILGFGSGIWEEDRLIPQVSEQGWFCTVHSWVGDSTELNSGNFRNCFNSGKSYFLQFKCNCRAVINPSNCICTFCCVIKSENCNSQLQGPQDTSWSDALLLKIIYLTQELSDSLFCSCSWKL